MKNEGHPSEKWSAWWADVPLAIGIKHFAFTDGWELKKVNVLSLGTQIKKNVTQAMQALVSISCKLKLLV